LESSIAFLTERVRVYALMFTRQFSIAMPASPSVQPQPGILAPVPAAAAYITLSRHAGASLAQAHKALASLAQLVDGNRAVLGVSHTFTVALGFAVPGLRPFPTLPGAKVDLPVNQSDLWLWVRGADAGEVFHTARLLQSVAAPAFRIDGHVPAFRYKKGHDLSGFEDGTENPKGRAALRAACVAEGPWTGASFVATQLWEHNFTQFDAMPPKARNHAVGRDWASNAELEEAPATAHVKRTAQENFSPQAFVLRRSMPWSSGARGGLVFVAFGHTFDAFEAQLARMTGAEDGLVDGLFSFSRPVSGGYYWCPPIQDGQVAFPPKSKRALPA
jgi:porphyrinogen peroxidase